jgi:hypothetical protein
MNNYQNTHLDEIPDLFCESCGDRIDEPSIFAEGTEYEREVDLCEKCLHDQVGETEIAIL